MNTVAIDFETFWSAEVSLKTMGTHAYLRHEQQDIYMLSVVADNGFQYVGRPENFDWVSISGPNFRVLAHNMTFEQQVIIRLKELGVVPEEWAPAELHCTADLCAYLAVPRDLAGACKTIFKEDISKNVRSNMKGRLPKDLSPQELIDLDEYALLDSIWCLKLWQKCEKHWPLWERDVSRINRETGIKGIDADYEGLEWAANHRLLKIMVAALKKIPWVPSEHAEAIARKEMVSAPGCAPLSIHAVRKECVRLGIEPPLSMAKDSDEFDKWFEENRRQVKWALAMRAFRRSNMLREKCLTIMERKKEDGRTPTSWLYAGAGNTKRFSGSGGVNYQNLSRGKIFGVDLRSYILPGEGKLFAISDLSQIEARALPWLTRDYEALEKMATGTSIYQIHAENQMGWSGTSLKKEEPLLYALAKARVLALGFGAGHAKFVAMAKLYIGLADYEAIFGVKVDSETVDRYVTHWERIAVNKGEENRAAWVVEWNALTAKERRFRVNSWLQVEDFRTNSPKVTALWRALDNHAKSSANSPERLLQLELPSGNKLTYRNCRVTGDGVTATIVRNGKFCAAKVYGGLLVENLCQALARDIFCYHMVEADKAGLDLCLHTHDELVARAEASIAETQLKLLTDIMSSNPPWIPDIPLAAEGETSAHYKK